MKPLFFILFCNVYSYSQNITEIEIFYIPWEFRSADLLYIDDVKNFNNHKNSYYCIQDSLILEDFKNSLCLLNFRPFKLKERISYSMAIEIYFDDGKQQVIGLDMNKSVKFGDYIYHRNYPLESWINKYVPPAKKWWKSD